MVTCCCLTKDWWSNRICSIKYYLVRAFEHSFPFILLIGFSVAGTLVIVLIQTYGEPYLKFPPRNSTKFVKCVESPNSTYQKAFYFTSTIFFSIGYGDIIPCTWLGKLTCILLALTGVPLTLFCLSRLGGPMHEGIGRAYGKTVGHCHCWWFSLSTNSNASPDNNNNSSNGPTSGNQVAPGGDDEANIIGGSRTADYVINNNSTAGATPPPGPSTSGIRQSIEAELNEIERDLEETTTVAGGVPQRISLSSGHNFKNHLPLSVGVFITLLWVFITSFYFWKCLIPDNPEDDWTYFDALYFTIISLFTIGFGDYTPSNRDMDILTFSFIFVGLALVSMCVSIAQRKMATQIEKISLNRFLLKWKAKVHPRNGSVSDLSDEEIQTAQKIIGLMANTEDASARKSSSLGVLGGVNEPSVNSVRSDNARAAREQHRKRRERDVGSHNQKTLHTHLADQDDSSPGPSFLFHSPPEDEEEKDGRFDGRREYKDKNSDIEEDYRTFGAKSVVSQRRIDFEDSSDGGGMESRGIPPAPIKTGSQKNYSRHIGELTKRNSKHTIVPN